MDHYQDISKALSRLDRSRGGSISMCRMQKVLQDCGCSLKEEELTQLLHRFALAGPTVAHCHLYFPVHSAGCHRDNRHIFPRPGYLLMGLSWHKAKRESNSANAQLLPQQRNHHFEPVFILSKSFMHLGRSQTAQRGFRKTVGPLPCRAPRPPPQASAAPSALTAIFSPRAFLSDKFHSYLLSFYRWAVSADFPPGGWGSDSPASRASATDRLTPQPRPPLPPGNSHKHKRICTASRVAASRSGVRRRSGFTLSWLAGHFSFPIVFRFPCG